MILLHIIAIPVKVSVSLQKVKKYTVLSAGIETASGILSSVNDVGYLKKCLHLGTLSYYFPKIFHRQMGHRSEADVT